MTSGGAGPARARNWIIEIDGKKATGKIELTVGRPAGMTIALKNVPSSVGENKRHLPSLQEWAKTDTQKPNKKSGIRAPDG